MSRTRTTGGSGGGGGAGGFAQVIPTGSIDPFAPRMLEQGDWIVFDPPLPRCQFKGGVVTAITDGHPPKLGVKLASGLVIGVYLHRIRKARWLELLALQAD